MTKDYTQMNPLELLLSYNVWVYDIEVTRFDWLLTAERLGSDDYVQFHNDGRGLKRWIDREKPILGSFNGKHYDDGVSVAMYHGGDNLTIKRFNDFIIVDRRNWWEFPFVNFKKKPFWAFDTKDELPLELSLKAIEGFMNKSIVESSIPFTIDRPLTPDELDEFKEYNHIDVKRTKDLVLERVDYLTTKMRLALKTGNDPIEFLGLTMAKVGAKYLKAVKVNYDDEFIYDPPETLRIGKYSEMVNFFDDPVGYTLNYVAPNLMKLYGHLDLDNLAKIKAMISKVKRAKDPRSQRYATQFFYEVGGVLHICAWGGIHGAEKTAYLVSDGEWIILTADVASYYPSMMIVYNYISRAIRNPEDFISVYDERIEAKNTGFEQVAQDLKDALNITYGGMKNPYNDLYDPRMASAICITGQLLLVDLIDKLEVLESMSVIQSNTDGIMFKVKRADIDKVHSIVTEWETRTRLSMEYTEIKSISQKDVNNYVMIAGETYLMKDGAQVVTKPDESKVKAKGGYASLFKGGSFKNNNQVVAHRALVGFLMYGKPVRETIYEATNIFDFQMIAKAGSKYGGAVHYVNGIAYDIQKVNRVYASSSEQYGEIKKVKRSKGVLSYEKINDTPDRCVIDNRGILTLDDIDREYYVALVESRISDYIGNKNKEDIIKMTQGIEVKIKDAQVEEVSGVKMDMHVGLATNSMNIYEKLNEMRLDWLKMDVKKSGKNMYAKFTYFELADIVPVVALLAKKYNVTPLVTFTEDMATMTLYDNDVMHIVNVGSDEMTRIEITSPMAHMTEMGQGGNPMQAIGGMQTYQRRYLYFNLLNIVESDEFDAMMGKVDELDDPAKPKTQGEKSNKVKAKTNASKATRPITDAERKDASEQVVDPNGQMDEAQEKAIKAGLKKLRSMSDEHEDFIKKVMGKVKAGVTKVTAEKILNSIRQKIQA